MGRKREISEEIRLAIRQNIDDLSMNKLAQKYGIDRRSVQFIMFPERYERHLRKQADLRLRRKRGDMS